MSDSNELYRFTFDGNNVTAVEEFEDGQWQAETIEAGESWQLVNGEVIKTETEDGKTETEVFRDLDGDGIFEEVEDTDDDDDANEIDDDDDANETDDDDDDAVAAADSGLVEIPATTTVSKLADTQNTVVSAEDASLARLYMAVFDRTPDNDGFTFWENQMDSGMSFETVIDSFLASAEFNAQYGNLSNSDFVSTLYQNVLDRQADAEGLQWWTGQLDAGVARSEVVRGFSESDEFTQNAQDDVNDFMAGLGSSDVLI